MKKIISFILVAIVALTASAQVDLVKKVLKSSVAPKAIITETKFHRHNAKRGGFVRYEEFEVPDVKAADALLGSAKVRRYVDFETDEEIAFLIISIGKDKNTEYIAVEDLWKVRDALRALKEKCHSDSVAGRSIKCFYTTEDGFKVGYNIKGGKATWFFTAGGVEYKFGKTYDFSAAISEIEKRLKDGTQ